MPITVPGIGYVGLGQQTTANQLVFSQAMGRKGGLRSAAKRGKRRAKKKAVRRVKRAGARRVRRAAKRGNKFTKGSAAAKRHMAKLRKMRRK